MSNRLRLSLTLASGAALLSPTLLATTTILVAHGRPEYSHITNTLSELGTAEKPNAWLMNVAGVVPAGLLVAMSALLPYRFFGSRAATAILFLGGVSLGATGVFFWRGGFPPDFTVLTNRLHFFFALVGFLCLATSPLVAAIGMRKSASMRRWFSFSLATGITILAIAFWPTIDYRGALQRAALMVFYAWLCAIAVRSLHAGSDRREST